MITELKKKYPEGSYGGECATWCHNLATFAPVGDSYKEKKAFVNANGIIMANISEVGRGFRAGDILITSEGTTLGFGNGHACFLLDPSKMTVAESNFNKDGKVHYGRVVPLNKIYGVIRAPLKIDLGQLEVNVSVLINNQKWKNLSVFDELQKDILNWTDNKLKVNFFPVLTKYNNWWYDTTIFPFTGQEVKVIAKAYMDAVSLLSFTSENKKADILAFVVRPNQWEGAITGGQELAYTNGRQIQACCAEPDSSPWYPMPLINHILIHEISHVLHDINGMNDTTHITDNQNRQLEKVFSDLDFNRIKINL